jgi:hypothetical protein
MQAITHIVNRFLTSSNLLHPAKAPPLLAIPLASILRAFVNCASQRDRRKRERPEF